MRCIQNLLKVGGMLQQQRLLKQRRKKIQCESLGDKGSIEIYTGLVLEARFHWGGVERGSSSTTTTASGGIMSGLPQRPGQRALTAVYRRAAIGRLLLKSCPFWLNACRINPSPVRRYSASR